MGNDPVEAPMKDSFAAPTRTYALVVGIEKYTLGLNADLDGPANDAHTFTDWLVSRGVPQENIAQVLSPLDGNSLSRYVSPRWPATRKGVSDAVHHWLKKQTGELLWVFWGGHGMITEARSRRLFYADTTREDWHHLDLNSLLIHLSSDNLSGFQRQIYLIDACATYQLPQERLGEGDRFAPGRPVRGREQFVFFATREGEVAKNLAQEQTGLFSKIVLEELEKEPLTPWSPDIDALARRVQDSFADSVKMGKTKQIPIFVSYRTGDGSEYALLQQGEQAWKLPLSRNAYFTGREDLIDHLYTALHQEHGTSLSQPQVVSGLGGIGKTQVVLEYAYRYSHEYHVVMWVNAATQATLIETFVAFASKLHLSHEYDPSDQQSIAQAIKHWLESTSLPWLLIFDNVDETENSEGGIERIRPFLPQTATGHMLVTTRTQTVGAITTEAPLEVPNMARMEGVLFLLRRAHRKEKTFGEHQNLSDKEIETVNDAVNLASALDNFPLALDQAGAYIQQTGRSLSSYFSLYQKTLGKTFRAQRGEPVTEYPQSVATTWEISFRLVKRRNAAATELLRLCAFLAPDAIPEDLLDKNPSYWNTSSKHTEREAALYAFDQAIAVLLKFSLIKRDEATETVSIHRLVQVVLKDAMKGKVQQRWAEHAVLATEDVFPVEQESETGMYTLRYLAQAQACAALIHDYDITCVEAVYLLTRTGNCVSQYALYTQAEELYKQALDIAKRSLHDDDPSAADPRINLGYLYAKQGKYQQAELLYQEAFDILERHFGSEHLDLALPLDHLALLYTDQYRYTEAEALLLRAVSLREQNLETQHIDHASSLTNLGNLYRKQGRYTEAEQFYQRSLSIQEHHLGPEHLALASIVHNVALVKSDQSKYAEAEPLYQRTLAIREHYLGPEHPEVADTLSSLAILYKEQGKYLEAELLYQRVLAIREKILGTNHQAVAQALHNLAVLSSHMNRQAEAEHLFQKAWHIWELALGTEHPDITYAMIGLADLYSEQGKYAEAEPLYQRALVIREQSLNVDSFEVAGPLTGLANLYAKQGKYAEAEPLYQLVLSIQEQTLEPGHPDIADSFGRLALLYANQGKVTEAEVYYLRALQNLEHVVGPDHIDLAGILNNLALFYSDQGNHEEAVNACQRALAIRERHLGSEHPDTANSLETLAFLYSKQGNYKQAELLFQKALETLTQGLGPHHPNVAIVLHDMAVFWEAQGRTEKAQAFYEHALAIREDVLGPSHPETIETRECYAALIQKKR